MFRKFVLHQNRPQVVLASSRAEKSLDPCIQNAGYLLAELRKLHDSDAKTYTFLQQLSTQNQDCMVLLGGNGSLSSMVFDHQLTQDVEYNKNFDLTASSFINIKATHCLVGTLQSPTS
ncbi:hypothetical protein MJO28_012211 [Puccinia striiformis f. sp. tritici]|uniref:Uncharacterized protein n=1 Tax=Puccinia striiformis f. sp. tritici TaxID=168172 RepID=A0ACC0E0V0_9BASI|nr:hypothetical protein MJO28_012211 [Puccinia striiformis f. sp. tritici]